MAALSASFLVLFCVRHCPFDLPLLLALLDLRVVPARGQLPASRVAASRRTRSRRSSTKPRCRTEPGRHRQLDQQPFAHRPPGRALSFDDLRGKPLVLSLIYTSCYQICPMTTRHLAKVVDKAREALGEDSFNVAVLGFDAYNDSPQAMLHFAQKQGIDERELVPVERQPGHRQCPEQGTGF